MHKPTAEEIQALVDAAGKALFIAPIYSGGRPDVARELRNALEPFKARPATRPEEVPFYQRTLDPELAQDMVNFFWRAKGCLIAAARAAPHLDLSHLIAACRAHGAAEPDHDDSLEGPPELDPNSERLPLVIVYNSTDIDSDINTPILYGPRYLKGTKYVTLDKGEEGGGRGETQPAEIALLEGGCHPSYPNYVEL